MEFGCTVAVIVTFDEPSNEAEPDKSPAREIALDVSSVVAVSAFPVRSPTKFALPLTLIPPENEMFVPLLVISAPPRSIVVPER